MTRPASTYALEEFESKKKIFLEPIDGFEKKLKEAEELRVKIKSSAKLLRKASKSRLLQDLPIVSSITRTRKASATAYDEDAESGYLTQLQEHAMYQDIPSVLREPLEMGIRRRSLAKNKNEKFMESCKIREQLINVKNFFSAQESLATVPRNTDYDDVILLTPAILPKTIEDSVRRQLPYLKKWLDRIDESSFSPSVLNQTKIFMEHRLAKRLMIIPQIAYFKGEKGAPYLLVMGMHEATRNTVPRGHFDQFLMHVDLDVKHQIKKVRFCNSFVSETEIWKPNVPERLLNVSTSSLKELYVNWRIGTYRFMKRRSGELRRVDASVKHFIRAFQAVSLDFLMSNQEKNERRNKLISELQQAIVTWENKSINHSEYRTFIQPAAEALYDRLDKWRKEWVSTFKAEVFTREYQKEVLEHQSNAASSFQALLPVKRESLHAKTS